jgi:hypothetical protein
MERMMKRFYALSLKIARKFAIVALATGVVGTGIVAAPSGAEARDRGRGAAVAAGIIGGLAVGALVAGSANNAYASPEPVYAPPYQQQGYYAAPAQPYYRPAPRRVAYPQGYYEASGYDEGPICTWRKQKIWLDDYTYQVRRVQVCN